MNKEDLERRIRALEEGINSFEGMDWIVKIGEMAEMKSALFDMPEEVCNVFTPHTHDQELNNLDDNIAIATSSCIPVTRQREAYNAAYDVLRRWLEPNFPGLRPKPKWDLHLHTPNKRRPFKRSDGKGS